MAKYVKKRTPVDAFRYGYEPHPNWFCGMVARDEIRDYETYCSIVRESGLVENFALGDYIIQKVNGEVYSLCESLFETVYEPAG